MGTRTYEYIAIRQITATCRSCQSKLVSTKDPEYCRSSEPTQGRQNRPESRHMVPKVRNKIDPLGQAFSQPSLFLLSGKNHHAVSEGDSTSDGEGTD